MTIANGMNRAERRAAAKHLAAESRRQPPVLRELPVEQWPPNVRNHASGPAKVFRSQRFLVQQFPAQAPAACRLSVIRTAMTGNDWQAAITWEELQRVKAEVGLSHAWAVEVYPSDDAVVNVANMRHLWVLAEAPDYAWR